MNQKKKRILNITISVIIGFIIVWFLLSKIEIKDIPIALSNIKKQDLIIAFILYVSAVFFKSVRFKVILRNNIDLGRIFSIVSLYTFFSNILPMRAGELSYMYLLKKKANTPETKGFASLIFGAFADMVIMLVAMFIVAWHLKDELAERSINTLISSVFGYLVEKITTLGVIIILLSLFLGIIFVFFLIRYRFRKYFIWIKNKAIEVLHELAFIRLDIRLLAIIIFSILIIIFRFSTQWYIIRSMGMDIDIWQFSFAILFGVLFSLIPIHGPAGFGTVEAPWVLALTYLNVSEKDAITSGFCLHIIIMVFCSLIGLYGAINLRKIRQCIE